MFRNSEWGADGYARSDTTVDVGGIHKIRRNQWRLWLMGALYIIHHPVRWPFFNHLAFKFTKSPPHMPITHSFILFIQIINHRLLLPLLSAGLHLPPLHLSMLAVSTPSKRSASVTGKTCVNSRREESVELAERRWWGRLHLVLSVLLRMSSLPSALWLFHPLTLRRRLK